VPVVLLYKIRNLFRNGLAVTSAMCSHEVESARIRVATRNMQAGVSQEA
jgi:hypothetical protein